MNAQGIIFDIKKYAIHDGPGIRARFFERLSASVFVVLTLKAGFQPEPMYRPVRC